MRFRHVALAIGLNAAICASAYAQPAAFDPTFGEAGIALGEPPSLSRDVAIDSEGRLAFVGARAPWGVPDGAFAGRLLPDGTPDSSFGSGGWTPISVICPIAPRAILEAVEVTAARGVVAAGTTGCRRGLVVHLLEDGTPDEGFGTLGVFQFVPDERSRSSAFHGVDVASDGKVVAVGREVREEPSGDVRTYLLVIRLTAQGQPDPSFGDNGVVRLRISDDLLADSQLSDVVVYPDGRVLSTGHVLVAGAYETVVVRLNADGTPDATFENGGVVLHDLGGNAPDVANALVYGPDGAIYLGGTLLLGNRYAFFAARLRFDGTRDPTFGTAGVTPIDAAAGASCVARDVVLDLEGRLALAGDCVLSAKQLWALARILPDGSIDSSFGGNGITHPSAPGTTQSLFGLVRQGDGRLVAAGSLDVSGQPVWAVMRLQGGSVTAAEPAPAVAMPLTVTPNPAHDAIRVRFDLEASAGATISVFDALGRLNLRLDAGNLPAGAQDRLLDVSSLAAGVYHVRVEAGAHIAMRTFTVR